MRRRYIYKTNAKGVVERIEVTPEEVLDVPAIHDLSLKETLHSESVERWHPDAPRHDEIGRAVFVSNREKEEFCSKNPDFVEAKTHAGLSVDQARKETARRRLNEMGRHGNIGKGNFFRYARE